MDVYLYRHFTDEDRLDAIPGEIHWMTNGLFPPLEEDGARRWQKASCRMMQAFYHRHGLRVTHWLAVVRGWTVEYVPVDAAGHWQPCPICGRMQTPSLDRTAYCDGTCERLARYGV
jgi:hypothetical protein